jgi:hypothetical protein
MAVGSGRSRSWLARPSGRLHLHPFASRFSRVPYWFTGKLLPLLVTVVAAFFTIVLVAHLDQDETAITNAAFAALATLGALSFSAARAVEEPARRAYVTAGEGFLFAALQVISASVIRYGATQLHAGLQDYPQARRVLDLGAGLLVALIFGFAMALVASSVRFLVVALEMRRLDEETADAPERAAR